jgi:hypothetical protein
MLFSQRYFRAIENNMLVVDIADAARRKLWAWLPPPPTKNAPSSLDDEIPF